MQKYEKLKDSKELSLHHEYEQFPFELLHKQHWDIEHITTQTDSKFDNEQDRDDWLNSVKTDYPEYFDYDDNKIEDDFEDPKAQIKHYLNLYEANKSKGNFDILFKKVIMYNDEQEKDSIKEENKNQLGNLVLLDSHTNRSFHNSLFPRKRRIVIIANGLESPDEEERNVLQVYVPPCTIQCFTKAYSKKSNSKLNAWLQSDANAYIKDIQQKLCDVPSKSIIRYFSK